MPKSRGSAGGRGARRTRSVPLLALLSCLAACAHFKSSSAPAAGGSQPKAPADSTLQAPSPPSPSPPPPAAPPPVAAAPSMPGAAPAAGAADEARGADKSGTSGPKQTVAAPSSKSGATDSAKAASTGAKKPAPPPPPTPAPAPAQKPAAPALDLASLEARLRDTHAIGVFTKLSLKNQVDDLLAAFGTFHAGKIPPTLADLHQRYEGLLLKVLTLLQDGDPGLASAISASRDAIWGILSNPDKFQKI